ncbi:MAG: hypothetical protein JSR85_03090 [Proteobacteria bacterium]|nr:hypothetical protein [Pseudomonadota bacterium]
MIKNMGIGTKSLIYILFSSCVYAGTVEIKNETDSDIIVFLRAHNQGTPYQRTTLSQHESKTLKVKESFLNLTDAHPFYDLIASSSLESDIEPDWRLLAGECDKLDARQNSVVSIQQLPIGKTTCKIVKKQY